MTSRQSGKGRLLFVIVRACRKLSPKVSGSATSKGHSQAPPKTVAGYLSMRTEEPSFWMKWEKCRFPFRQNYCGFCRIMKSREWAVRLHTNWIFALSRQQIATYDKRCWKAASAK